MLQTRTLVRELIVVVILASSASFAQAVVVVNENDFLDTDSQLEYPADSTDLINQSTPTFLSQSQTDYTPNFGASPIDRLNDGQLGTPSSPPETVIGLASTEPLITSYTTTFHLNTSTNTLGYDINLIETISGWNDNRIWQSYEVFYSTVSSNPSGLDTPGLFTSLQSVLYQPASGGDRSAKVSLGITGLSYVNALQFVVTISPPGGTESVYREFNAYGVATTPEPSSSLMLVLGTAGLMRFRSSRRQRSLSGGVERS